MTSAKKSPSRMQRGQGISQQHGPWNHTMKRAPKSPDERILAALARKAEQQAEAVKTNIEALDKQLKALNTGLSVKLNADGSRTLKGGRRSLTIGTNTATMQRGTVFAQVGHAVMHAAESRKAVEATAAKIILDHLPAGIGGRTLATMLTRMFTTGLWLTGSREAILSGAAARRTAPSIRPIISRLIAKARSEHDEEAARRVRQALNIAPGLAVIMHENALLGMAIEGDSISDMAAEVDATEAIRHLSPSSVTLLTKDNAPMICWAIDAAREGGVELPTGRKQRLWLQAIVPLLSLRDPADGFRYWLCRKSAEAEMLGMLDPDALNVTALWASAKRGHRDGWKASMSLARAMLAAAAWREGQEKQKRNNPATDAAPESLPAETVGRFHVHQLLTVADLMVAGTELGVCLASMPEAFHARAVRREAAVLGLYEVKTTEKGEAEKVEIGRIVAAAEVTLPDLTVLQFRTRFNGSPSPHHREALEAYLAAHRPQL